MKWLPYILLHNNLNEGDFKLHVGDSVCSLGVEAFCGSSCATSDKLPPVISVTTSLWSIRSLCVELERREFIRPLTSAWGSAQGYVSRYWNLSPNRRRLNCIVGNIGAGQLGNFITQTNWILTILNAIKQLWAGSKQRSSNWWDILVELCLS